MPFADGPQRNIDLINRYDKWLTATETPMLLFYVNPGAIISPATAAKIAGRLKNIETRYLGPGLHFIQEDYPHQIGLGIADWRQRFLKASGGE
ncbi:MAG: hypothetical protein V3R73_03105 [Sphingomonadales bacterium]